jgi:hypothetical protein
MKTAIKKDRIITDADFEGPMMVYNPMTKKQEKELGEWVAKQKAKFKAKQLKAKG